MKIYNIPLNTSLEIKFTYKGKECSMGVKVFKVEGVCLWVPAILCNGNPLHPSEMQGVQIIYKSDDGIYIYHELDIRLCKLNESNIYEIATEENADKSNRRQSYRLFIGQRQTIHVHLSSGGTRECLGILKDISSMGMGVILNKYIEDVEFIEITFDAFDNFKTTIKGNVVRVEKCMNNKGILYGCQLEKDSSEISKFVMERQASIRRRSAIRN